MSCDQGIWQRVEEEYLTKNTKDVHVLLRLLPESVSRTVHEQTSPQGATFRCFMLLMALLLLDSHYPEHELVDLGLDAREIAFQTWRALCPVAGVIMLIFIPMSCEYAMMTDRFKRETPCTSISDNDKLIYLRNKFQVNMHNLAGAICFGLTPAYEGWAIGRSTWLFFMGAGSGECAPNARCFVRWGDGSRAATFWLLLQLSRSIALLAGDFCMLSMIYEYMMEPTSRWVRNPLYIYRSQAYLIQELTNYVLLTGMSIWFVDLAAWHHQSDAARVTLQILAGISMVR